MNVYTLETSKGNCGKAKMFATTSTTRCSWKDATLSNKKISLFPFPTWTQRYNLLVDCHTFHLDTTLCTFRQVSSASTQMSNCHSIWEVIITVKVKNPTNKDTTMKSKKRHDSCIKMLSCISLAKCHSYIFYTFFWVFFEDLKSFLLLNINRIKDLNH